RRKRRNSSSSRSSGCRIVAPRSKGSGRPRLRGRRKRRNDEGGLMKRLVGAFLAAALCGTALVAQETRSSTLLTTEHYLNWERVNDAQISPDGSRIVYTRQAVNQLEDKWESALWILNADGSQHRF